MIDNLTSLTADARLLIQAVVVVFAIGMVVATWARTKSAVPTVATLVMAAIVIWGVNNIDVLQSQVNEDLNGAPASVELEVTRVDA
ncbi:MAG: hypothetical protein OSA99_19160 [Acidimicrobiales bacterium]|nr:hypothetical protein [Acidimicrobiales bacterium]